MPALPRESRTLASSASLRFPFAISFFASTSVRGGRVALPLFALSLGASPFTVGLLAAAFSVMPMLLAVPVGRLADRFGSRWPLALGITGGAIGMLVPYFFGSIPALFFAALMNGLAFSFYGVPMQNVVGLISTTENRVKNFSSLTLIVSIASFTGPLFAGVAMDHLGPSATCLALALLTVVPVLMLVFRGGVLPRGTGKPIPPGEGILKSLTQPGMARILAISSLMLSGFELFMFYIPVYAHSLGMSGTTIGIILASFATASFVVRLAIPRLLNRFGLEQVLTGAFLVSAAMFFIVPFFQSALALCIIAFIFGMGVSVGQPITMSMSFTTAADGRSGETMGIRQSVNHVTRIIGPTLFGTLGTAFGLHAVFWTNALMLVAGGLVSRRKPGGTDKGPG